MIETEPAKISDSEERPPKVFLSYSWSSPLHEEWVLQFANELRSGWGVDAILDKTHLRGGDDAIAFMERMVTDETLDKVILVCDSEYAEKADSRRGGAGTEAQIITPELYKQTAEEGDRKYAAVIRERDEDGDACIPAFYGGRIYFDLTDESKHADEMEALARWCYGEYRYEPAELGSPPQFARDDNAPSLGTSGLLQRVTTALEQGHREALGVMDRYFDTFAKNIARYAIESSGGRYQLDDVVKGIKALKKPRDEAERVLVKLCQYRQGEEAMHHLIHRFIERLMPYTDHQLEQASDIELNEGKRQAFLYLVPEIIRIAAASLIQVDDFEGIGVLTNEVYSAGQYSGAHLGSVSQRFPALQFGIRGLSDDRSSQASLARRTSGADLSLGDLAEADLLLTVISFAQDSLREEQSEENMGHISNWYPDVLHEVAPRYRGAFPIFVRARSKRYLAKMESGLGISAERIKKGIALAAERFKKRHRVDYPQMANADGLGTTM